MKTKEKVKAGNLSPKEAYDVLYPLVGEDYAKFLPTLRWLKNLVQGRKITHTKSRQQKKQDFTKK